MLQLHITIDDERQSLAVVQAIANALGGNVSAQSATQVYGVPPTAAPESPSATPVTGAPAQPITGQVPAQPAEAAPVTPPPAVPTSAPVYTMDQLAVAATQLMDAGRQQELIGLLNSFGVQALTSLPKEQYGAFATHLRAMGAKI